VLRELEEQRVEATFRCSIYLYCGACLQRLAVADCCLAWLVAVVRVGRVVRYIGASEVKFNAMSSDARGRSG
jgi:hypothetical protein